MGQVQEVQEVRAVRVREAQAVLEVLVGLVELVLEVQEVQVSYLLPFQAVLQNDARASYILHPIHPSHLTKLAKHNLVMNNKLAVHK